MHTTAKSAPRIVCLGDSITDGYTYAQLIMQALAEAGETVPACICSGVCGETAEQMEARFDRTVAAFQPDLVTFSAGTNDAIKNATREQYKKSVRSILAAIKAMNIQAIVLTPCEYLARVGTTEADKDANKREVDRRLDHCEVTLRQAAREFGFPIAENRALMRAAVNARQNIMTGDGIHPNYRGQQLMARSILDAMGHERIALPATFQPKLCPGVIRKWKARLSPHASGQPVKLTPETIDLFLHDESCTAWSLPEEEPFAPSPEEWMEQLRQNGYSVRLERLIGKGPAQAWTEVHVEQAKTAYLQISTNIATIWLNGRKVHDQGDVYNGNHAGKDRIPVTLQAGRNLLAIEITGPFFYFALTPNLVWEDQLAAQYSP